MTKSKQPLIDTHVHLSDERFDADRPACVERAAAVGVEWMLLPAVDSASNDRLIETVRAFPERCRAMMGLHPTAVNDNPAWREELAEVGRLLKDPPVPFVAVGETGLDLHWSTDFLPEQQLALRRQIEWALEVDLPIVLHMREAFEEMARLLADYRGSGLRGVFHSFAGTAEQYRTLRAMGDFRFGIGGVVTYKNSMVAAAVAEMALEDLVLETDAPYLPPVPFRGERNESAHLPLIVEKIAALQGRSPEEVARATTGNAVEMFKL